MKEKIYYTFLGSVILVSYYIYMKPKPSYKNQQTQTYYYDKHDQSCQTDENEQSSFFESIISEHENLDYTEGVFSFSSQLTNSSDNSDIDWKSVSQGLK